MRFECGICDKKHLYTSKIGMSHAKKMQGIEYKKELVVQEEIRPVGINVYVTHPYNMRYHLGNGCCNAKTIIPIEEVREEARMCKICKRSVSYKPSLSKEYMNRNACEVLYIGRKEVSDDPDSLLTDNDFLDRFMSIECERVKIANWSKNRNEQT